MAMKGVIFCPFSARPPWRQDSPVVLPTSIASSPTGASGSAREGMRRVRTRSSENSRMLLGKCLGARPMGVSIQKGVAVAYFFRWFAMAKNSWKWMMTGGTPMTMETALLSFFFVHRVFFLSVSFFRFATNMTHSKFKQGILPCPKANRTPQDSGRFGKSTQSQSNSYPGFG